MRGFRLLDLFCGAGGAARGYRASGFWVIGVDSEDQPNYGQSFWKGDWEEGLSMFGESVDAVHASPPCQRYSWSTRKESRLSYPDLVDDVRDALVDLGKPWVIENVHGAPLVRPIELCGAMFGLNVLRHRLFECSHTLFSLAHPEHERPGLHKNRNGDYVKKSTYCCVAGHGGNGWSSKYEDWCRAMGIPRGSMTKQELTQAIPPAYTEFIGNQLAAVILRG